MAAIVGIVPPALRRAIDLPEAHMAKGDHAMTGRHALICVFRHFTMESPVGTAHVYEDFMSLKLRGKDVTSVQKYMDTWETSSPV